MPLQFIVKFGPGGHTGGDVGPAGVAGVAFTVTVAALFAVPPGVVTLTIPVVPAPTITVMADPVLEAIDATGVPPMVIDEAPDKLLPLIIKDEPVQTSVAESPLIVGGKAVPVTVTQ
ncbi:MAG TPA: hypothetical protein DCQ15_09200 [Chitinophagaceae bacterium]|nr:hypothetical protein [Chitinophagaceae bacterium]